jgi:hypothetical protein
MSPCVRRSVWAGSSSFANSPTHATSISAILFGRWVCGSRRGNWRVAQVPSVQEVGAPGQVFRTWEIAESCLLGIHFTQMTTTSCGHLSQRIEAALYQGTTLVVPQVAQNKGRALAPEGHLSRPSPFIHSFSPACLAPGLEASDLAAEFRGAEAPRSLRLSACEAHLNQEESCSQGGFADHYPPLAHTANRVKPRCLWRAEPCESSETSPQPSRPRSACARQKSGISLDRPVNPTNPVSLQ